MSPVGGPLATFSVVTVPPWYHESHDTAGSPRPSPSASVQPLGTTTHDPPASSHPASWVASVAASALASCAGPASTPPSLASAVDLSGADDPSTGSGVLAQLRGSVVGTSVDSGAEVERASVERPRTRARPGRAASTVQRASTRPPGPTSWTSPGAPREARSVVIASKAEAAAGRVVNARARAAPACTSILHPSCSSTSDPSCSPPSSLSRSPGCRNHGCLLRLTRRRGSRETRTRLDPRHPKATRQRGSALARVLRLRVLSVEDVEPAQDRDPEHLGPGERQAGHRHAASEEVVRSAACPPG